MAPTSNERRDSDRGRHSILFLAAFFRVRVYVYRITDSTRHRLVWEQDKEINTRLRCSQGHPARVPGKLLGVTAQMETHAAGMLAGMAAGALLYPLELVETRLAMSGRGGGGVVEVARRVLREEGARGLFRGASASVVGQGVNWMVYTWPTRTSFACCSAPRQTWWVLRVWRSAGGVRAAASVLGCEPLG